MLYRDGIRNNDWWSYNGYIQDAFSRGKLRLNGGLRYDWQQSKHRGGCVAPNPIRPDLLPAQCDEATQTDSITGKSIKPFANFAPRLSATYDLFGNGKTSVHASFSYYYQTKITLANSLTGLFDVTTLTWGDNLSSGACNTTAGGSCWNDANLGVKLAIPMGKFTITPAMYLSIGLNDTVRFIGYGDLLDPGRTKFYGGVSFGYAF